MFQIVSAKPESMEMKHRISRYIFGWILNKSNHYGHSVLLILIVGGMHFHL